MPRLPYSSSATAATSRSPGKPRIRFCQRLGGGHASGEAALHVVGAAAVELAVADGAGKRLGHAGDIDRVAMRVEHQGAAAARAREPADDAGAARFGLESLGREPDRAQRFRNESSNLALTGRARARAWG